MKARVIATGEIVEVKVYKREHRLYIRTHGEKTGEIYRAKDLDFNINGKFVENCLNGIKQGIDYNPDYWTRLEHQAAIGAMQGMLNNSLLINGLLKVNKSHEDIVAEVTGTAIRYSRALVEKMKEERK